MKILHLSDLHFKGSTAGNRKKVETLKYVEENYPAHHIVVTGDVVDDGGSEQYRRAERALRPFKGRISICPGNHDSGIGGNIYNRKRIERFDKYLAGPFGQCGTFAGDNSPVVNIVESDEAKCMFIALDTNLETKTPFDFACGKVGRKQLKELDSILKQYADSELVKILFFHHHPFVTKTLVNLIGLKLKDSEELMKVVSNRVDVMLFGHKHEPYIDHGKHGIQYILGADNSPGRKSAREISISGGNISVNDVPIR
ncbi:metallophosphoesterase family protein [Maridesulfovibrio sp. FT414]|uniref:metallophosphoesterase family protein n=1 Tax=Maridesulfovibrio sp. FT414 TaxID=2979469 RepID=UPI003D802F4A